MDSEYSINCNCNAKPDAIAATNFSIPATSALPRRAKPWRTAFWLDPAFPPLVLGPVLRLALVQLASICRCDVMSSAPRLLVARSQKLPNGLKHQGFSDQKSNNLAAERTGISSQTERY
jgi:hypothetical protein